MVGLDSLHDVFPRGPRATIRCMHWTPYSSCTLQLQGLQLPRRRSGGLHVAPLAGA